MQITISIFTLLLAGGFLAAVVWFVASWWQQRQFRRIMDGKVVSALPWMWQGKKTGDRI